MSRSGEGGNPAAAGQTRRGPLRLGYSHQPRGRRPVHKTRATFPRGHRLPRLGALSLQINQAKRTGGSGCCAMVGSLFQQRPQAPDPSRAQTQKDLSSIPGRSQGRGVVRGQRNQRWHQESFCPRTYEASWRGRWAGESQDLRGGGMPHRPPGCGCVRPAVHSGSSSPGSRGAAAPSRRLPTPLPTGAAHGHLLLQEPLLLHSLIPRQADPLGFCLRDDKLLHRRDRHTMSSTARQQDPRGARSTSQRLTLYLS